MKSKNSLWSLSPKAMELPPHASANLMLSSNDGGMEGWREKQQAVGCFCWDVGIFSHYFLFCSDVVCLDGWSIIGLI